MIAPQLPPQFHDLEPLLAWALPTERARSARRQASTMSDIRALYDTLLPRMDAVLSYLSAWPDEASSPPEVRTLFHLALALAEVAPAVENYGQPSVVDGYDVARFVALHDQPGH